MPEIIDGIYLHAYLTESQIDLGGGGLNKDREIVYVSDWDISTYVPGTDPNPQTYTPAYEVDIGGGTVIRRSIVTWEALIDSGGVGGGLDYIEDGDTLGVIRSKDPDSSRGAITGYTEGQFSFILGDYVKAEGEYGNFVHGFNSFIKGPFSSMAQSIGNYNVVDNHPQSGIFGGWNNMIGLAKVRYVVKSRVSAEPPVSTDVFHDLFVVEAPFDTFSAGDIVWWEGGVLASGGFGSEDLNNGDIVYSIDDEAYYQFTGGALVEVIPSAPPVEANQAQFDAVLGGYQNVVYGNRTSASIILGGNQNKLGSTISPNASVQFSSIISSELCEIDYSVDDVGEPFSTSRNVTILNSWLSTIKGTTPGWMMIDNSMWSDILVGPNITGAGGFTSKLFKIDNSYQSTITGGPGLNYAITNSESCSLTFDNQDADQGFGPYYRGVSIHDSYESSITNHAYSSIRNSNFCSMTSDDEFLVAAAVIEGLNVIEASISCDITNFVKYSAIRNSANSAINGITREFARDTPNNFINYSIIEGSINSTIYAISNFTKIAQSEDVEISGAYTGTGNSGELPVFTRVLGSRNVTIDKSGFVEVAHSSDVQVLGISKFAEVSHSEGSISIRAGSVHSSIRQSDNTGIYANSFSVVEQAIGSNVLDVRINLEPVSNIFPFANQPSSVGLLPSSNNSDIYYMIAGSGWPEDAASNGKQIARWDASSDTWSYINIPPGTYVKYTADLFITIKFDKVDSDGNNVWVDVTNSQNFLVARQNRIEQGSGAGIVTSSFSFARGESQAIDNARNAQILGGQFNSILAGGENVVNINAITFSGTTATASSSSEHGLTTTDEVVIAGVTGPTPDDADLYNGTFLITVIDPFSFEYTMRNTPTGNATGGSITGTHKIHGGYSAIVTGGQNTIQGTGIFNFIGAGQQNRIEDAESASIVGGAVNRIISTGKFQFIGGGYNNTIQSPDASIVGGVGNFITDGSIPEASSGAVIAGGLYNSLVGASAGGIFAGRTNLIVDDSDTSNRSVIVGGDTNIISAASGSNIIGAGSQNTIGVVDIVRLTNTSVDTTANTISVSIPNDTTIRINDGTSEDSSELSPFRNLTIDNAALTPDRVFFVVNDTGTTIQLANTLGGAALNISEVNNALPYKFEIILTDNAPWVAQYSGILAGERNAINAQSSAIIAGLDNYVDVINSVIATGLNNRIEFTAGAYTGGYNFIGGGVNNRIQIGSTGTDSFIGGGELNEILSASLSKNSIVSGYLNKINGGENNFIGAGNSNRIRLSDVEIYAGANGAAIITGESNPDLNFNEFNRAGTSGNEIIGACEGALIGSGRANRIVGTAVHNAIITGFDNTIAADVNNGSGGSDSFIGGGEYNGIGSTAVSITATGLSGGQINIPVEYMYEGHIKIYDFIQVTGTTDLSSARQYIVNDITYVDSTTARISVADQFESPRSGAFSNITITNDTGIIINIQAASGNSSGILSGFSNVIYSANSSITGGSRNIIGPSSANSSIVGGLANVIDWSSTGGFGSGESTIIGGNSNNIKGVGMAVIAGCGNVFIDSTVGNGEPSSSIFSTDQSTITDVLFGGVISSSTISLSDSRYIFVAASNSSSISASSVNCAIIGGGSGATLSGNDHTILLGDVSGPFNDNTTYMEAISKTSGTFRIKHPNPEKKDSHMLYHSFVESPTAGDNLYTYVAEAMSDGEVVKIELPDYWHYLNENPRMFIQAKDMFAHAFGKVVGDTLEITCEKSGTYDVLLIGTRKDEDAVSAWKGVEREN